MMSTADLKANHEIGHKHLLSTRLADRSSTIYLLLTRAAHQVAGMALHIPKRQSEGS